MVYCWKCGSQVGEQAALCPKCGATLRRTMGVQSPTGFELLRDDKSVQNHWARRVVERIDGKSMDLRSSFIRNISKIYWLLLVLDVAVGLGTHGEMSQKWSDRFTGTKVEAKTHMTIIP